MRRITREAMARRLEEETAAGKRRARASRGLAAFALLAASLAPPAWADEVRQKAMIAEVRRAFTFDGKLIPPEIFRDFGDGDLADSAPIWLTVDVEASIGSNLYADAIERRGRWVVQRKVSPGHPPEDTGYDYRGATANGLLVALASFSGGGSGDFISLHILELGQARAFDGDGKPRRRIVLTNLRTIALGDRWDGEVRIDGDAIRVVTTRKGPADDGGRSRTLTIAARRP
ncbi:MAG: hypothetical protein ABR970_14295 [Roseiarcus sp.]